LSIVQSTNREKGDSTGSSCAIGDIVIDPQFKESLRPLTEEECTALEASIRAEGCRDALVVWPCEGKLILLDGHNRKEICEWLGSDYGIVEIHRADREEAADWVDKNQLGRRNLNREHISLLRGRRYIRATKRQGQRSDLDWNQESSIFNVDGLPVIDAEVDDLDISTSCQSVRKSTQIDMSTEIPDAAGCVEATTSYQGDKNLTTAEEVAADHGVSERTIHRDAKFATAVEKLKQTVPDIEQRVISGDIPSKSAVMDAARRPDKAQEILYRKPHVAYNSGNNEWYTPKAYADAAREVLGSIDLDPASHAEANEVIQAKRYFTIEENGLEQEWYGNVWMNPPYSGDLVLRFCRKLIEEHRFERIQAACVLVNNATETYWFQSLFDIASAICFPKGRIRFWRPEEDTKTPLQGQAVFYIGVENEKFSVIFGEFGKIVNVP